MEKIDDKGNKTKEYTSSAQIGPENHLVDSLTRSQGTAGFVLSSPHASRDTCTLSRGEGGGVFLDKLRG